MVAQCGAAAQGTVLRLVKLNTCGAPVTGASSAVVVTDGYISVQSEAQYEDGDAIRTKKASGQLCINRTGPNAYVNSKLTIAMCVLDPDANTLIMGSRLITSGSVTGTGTAYGYNNAAAHYSLETWQPISGQGACDPNTGLQRYVYWAWPHVWNTKLLSFTIENGALSLSYEAITDYPSALWGDGPGTGTSWLPGVIDTSTYFDDFLWNITTTAPPTAPTACGAFLLT
jgi:hypothetical protein